MATTESIDMRRTMTKTVKKVKTAMKMKVTISMKMEVSTIRMMRMILRTSSAWGLYFKRVERKEMIIT